MWQFIIIIKKLGMVMLVNPALGRQSQDFWSWLVQQSGLSGEFQVSERPYLRNKRLTMLSLSYMFKVQWQMASFSIRIPTKGSKTNSTHFLLCSLDSSACFTEWISIQIYKRKYGDHWFITDTNQFSLYYGEVANQGKRRGSQGFYNSCVVLPNCFSIPHQ